MNHHQKGTQVNHTELAAKILFFRTGFFATRGASLCAKGSGAPSVGLLVALAIAMAALFASLATGAQAAGYTAGTPLSTGKLTSGVAVNQSNHNVYVADNGVFA